MRIWDIHPKYLCRQHLLGEHRELHAIWTILVKKKKGYSKHPETLRWKGKLPALFSRHTLLVTEMKKRGYTHHSPLLLRGIRGIGVQKEKIESVSSQKQKLTNKPCPCFI